MQFNSEDNYKTIGITEILIALLFFAFMIIHPRYLGLRNDGLSLLPVTLLTLPTLFLYLYVLINRKVKRETFNLLIVIAFFTLYLGIKIYRGMDSIGREGDRDDALYQSVYIFLQGVYPFDKGTFCCNPPITAGPASVLFSLPFVKFFNNINILSTLVMAFIVFYLWKYIERVSVRPILTLALIVMVFHPYFNWCYWESSEELLYGMPFLYLAVLIFLKQWLCIKWPKFFIIGILLGISSMVRICYMLPAVMVLFLIYRNSRRYLIYSIIGIVLTVSLFSLPFLILNYKHFLFHYLWGATLYQKGNFEIAFFVAIIFIWSYSKIIKNFPLASQAHILIALAVITGHIYSGLLLIPWHVYYWMIPVLIAVPFLEKPQESKISYNDEK